MLNFTPKMLKKYKGGGVMISTVFGHELLVLHDMYISSDKIFICRLSDHLESFDYILRLEPMDSLEHGEGCRFFTDHVEKCPIGRF